MRFLWARAPVFIVTLPAERAQVPRRRSCAAGSPRQHALQLMSRHVRSLPQPSRAHFKLPRYNLGAFLLVHRPSQQDEAASLLRSAHSVRKLGPHPRRHNSFFYGIFMLGPHYRHRDGLYHWGKTTKTRKMHCDCCRSAEAPNSDFATVHESQCASRYLTFRRGFPKGCVVFDCCC